MCTPLLKYVYKNILNITLIEGFNLPVKCIRPLCSATVFAFNSIAAALDDYTFLVDVLREYSREDFKSLDLEREASVVADAAFKVNTETAVVGAAGGGCAQLSAVFKGVFLPCNILTPVRRLGVFDPDDCEGYVKEAVDVVSHIAPKYRDSVDFIIHYDPVHDRGWVRRNLTIRLHLKKLPNSYKRVLTRCRRVFLINVKHPWTQFKLDENVYVQVGGADGLSDRDYIEYSERVHELLKELGVKNYPWICKLLEECEKVKAPESEWGVRESFLSDVEEFCKERGIDVIRVDLEIFHELSVLGTAAYLASNLSGESRGAVVENYKQSCSTTFIRRRLVPVWAVFTTSGSLKVVDAVLKHISSTFDIGELIYVTVPYGYREQGHKWPDSVSFEEWKSMLRKYCSNLVTVPEKVFSGASTRTLEVMNEIYRRAWELGRGFEPPKNIVVDLEKFRKILTDLVGVVRSVCR